MSDSVLQISLDNFFFNFLNSLGYNLVRPNEFSNKYFSLLRACQIWDTVCTPLSGLAVEKWSSGLVWFWSFEYNHRTTCLAVYHRAELTDCARYFLLTRHKLETPGKKSPQLRIVSIRLTMGMFVVSCLLMDEIGPILLWVVLLMGRRSWVG